MKILFLTLALLVASFSAFAEHEPPTSFRDIPFGSSSSLLKDQIKLVENANGLKCYQKNKERLNIGDADLQEITYCYYKDQLYVVLLKFVGSANYGIISDILNQKYGDGYRPNKFTEEYYWGLSTPVTIYIEYSDISKKGSLYYRYNPVSEERENNQKERNKNSTSDL